MFGVFIVLFVAIAGLAAFSPTIGYIALLPWIYRKVDNLEPTRRTAILASYFLGPVVLWGCSYAILEYPRLEFKWDIRAVPVRTKSDDLPLTLVVPEGVRLFSGPKCSLQILVAETDRIMPNRSNGQAQLRYQRTDPRYKSGENPKIPQRYLILRLESNSKYWKSRDTMNDSTLYELTLMEGASEELVALDYPPSDRPLFFPPLMTIYGWLRRTNATTSDDISERISSFVHKATDRC